MKWSVARGGHVIRIVTRILRMLRLLLILILFSVHSFSFAQENHDKLDPALRPFRWMLGDWELLSINTYGNGTDDRYMIVPRKRWLNVSISEDGKLLLKYEYQLFSKARIERQLFAQPDRIVRHVETVFFDNGQLTVAGQVLNEEADRVSTKNFRLALDRNLSDRIVRGNNVDTFQHLSFRTALTAKLVHSYANASYLPFTPRDPKTEENPRRVTKD